MRGATRRVAARLSAQPDGSPSALPVHGATVRQATVDSVDTDAASVFIGGDDSGEPALVGWVGKPPAAGDTVWLVHSGATAVVLGAQGQPADGYLDRADNGSGSGTVGTSMTTVLSLQVSIPTGLPAGAKVKVEGDVFVSTAAGIGSAIGMSGMSDPAPTRTVNQSASYDGHLVGYDVDPSGTRTYNLRVQCVTASNVATWRAPSLRAELQF